MKLKNYLFLLLFLTGGVLSIKAQCKVDAGNNKTIQLCGDQVQLDVEPLWNEGIDTMPFSQYSVHFLTSEVGYSAGYQASIHKTVDGGKTFSYQKIGNYSVGNFSSIFFTDSNNGYIVGGQVAGSNTAPVVIVKTTDAGNSWNEIATSFTGYLNSCYFTSNDTGFAVGQNGLIIKTVNAGASWTQKTTNTLFELKSVTFINSKIGYAVGTASVLKTIDGGETWTNVSKESIDFTNNYLTKVFFINENIGFMTGNVYNSGGPLFKTTDGGSTWQQKFLAPGEALKSLFCVDENTIYIGTVAGNIIRTTDGGSTWYSQKVNLGEVSDISFPDSKTGYAGGLGGKFKLVKYTQPDDIVWSPSTGLSSSTIANPIANPQKTTTYKATVTTGSCVAVDSVTVFVNPFTVEAGADKDLVCGGTAQLDEVKTNYTGTETLSYSWTPADGLSATNISNPTVKIKKTTTYYVTVTNPGGCTATDSLTIFVTPLVANSSGPVSLICGGSGQFNDVLTNYTGTDALTYTWLPSSGLNDSTIAKPIVTVTKMTYYILTVATANGCEAKDTVVVQVDPLVANAGNDKIKICGDTTLLDNVVSNYTGTVPLIYSWLPTTGLNNATIPNPRTGAHDLTYTVTITTSNGCQASDQVRVDLKPMDAPAICMVGVDSTGKNVIRWNNLSSNAIDSVFIYKETTVSGNYVKIGSVSASKNGFKDSTSQPEVKSSKYKISLLDTCGLESPKSLHHKTMHLAIAKGVGTAWNLIWESYEGFAVPTYNIYRGTDVNNLQFLDATSGTSNQYTNYNPPPGDLYYQVEVVNPSPCDASNLTSASRSNIAVSKFVGIFEQEKSTVLFSVYPNPAADELTVNVENVLTKSTALTIYNSLGATVKVISVQQNKQKIDISDLSSGFYMMELKSVNGRSVQKLTIEK